MDISIVRERLVFGEESRTQFKRTVHSSDQLASEMVAFSNSKGGIIYVGVEDDGTIVGLSPDEVRILNQWISSAASQSVHPAINPESEAITVDGRIIVVIVINEGLSKPYTDNHSAIWVKSGADKRRVTAREELQRMFQAGDFLHADEMPVPALSPSDIELLYFGQVYEKIYGETLDEQELPLPQLLQNMNLAKDGVLNLSGALLFSRKSRFFLPSFIVKAVKYSGSDINVDQYRDSRDFTGVLEEIFESTMQFIMNNIPYSQKGQHVNSIAEPAVQKIVFEELLANALLHRDYFISAAIRVFVFDDRVEIINPGHLPNNLTIGNIKAGVSVARNPVLTSFGTAVLPYRGLGNGIRRVLKIHKSIDFIDDREANQFKAIVYYDNSPR